MGVVDVDDYLNFVANASLGAGVEAGSNIGCAVVADRSGHSVVVEIEGGGGFVEQLAQHPLGDSVAPCSNDTSANWYIADGFTREDSVETLILSNPFDEAVVARLRFSSETREAQPSELGGFTVLPRSVRTITIAELGARDEPIISVAVEATSGRLVVGRVQEYRGARVGYDVSLAAPELRDQWWFADGERTEGVTETFSIYNPTDDEVEVTVFFGGLPLEASAVNEGDPIIVPPLRAVIFDPTENRAEIVEGEPAGDAQAEPEGQGEDEATDESGDSDDFVELQPPSTDLPEGRHATVFSTLAQPSIVVERILTRPAGGSIATSVVLGAPPRPDGFVPNTWHMGIGPTVPTEQALVVYNIDQVEAAITVSVVGPDGPSAIPSLTDVALPSGSIITVDLVDEDVLGREIIVVSSSRVFVERSLPRGNDLPGRSGSWLLPQSG